MAEKQGEEPYAAGGDRISELPDGILHSILRRIPSEKQAAQTSVLSKRWRSLWRSYPVMEFYQSFRNSSAGDAAIKKMMNDLQNFSEASVERFSRDNLLRLQTLRLAVVLLEGTLRSPAIEQLLDLASKTEVEEVSIKVFCSPIGLDLPFRSLPISSAKFLELGSISLKHGDDLVPSLNSLRFLKLFNVEFEDCGLLTNLIASSPFLETLDLRCLGELKNLQVFNVTNLKSVLITDCCLLEEIEINAPALEFLCLDLYSVSKMELVAPQLKDLLIIGSELSLSYLGEVISRLHSLRTFTLFGLKKGGRKLKLSSPKLETFRLCAPSDLEEIELDTGPGLTRFLLFYHESSPGNLQKCVISNAAVCEWEVSFSMEGLRFGEGTHAWFVGLRSFVRRFANHSKLTISVLCSYPQEVIFRKEEVDHTTRPLRIKRLKILTSSLPSIDEGSLLDGLFWACRPTFLTIFHTDYKNPKRLLEAFLSLRSYEKGFKELCSWQWQLKRVQMIMAWDGTFENASQKYPDLMSVAERTVHSFETANCVSFFLTWY